MMLTEQCGVMEPLPHQPVRQKGASSCWQGDPSKWLKSKWPFPSSLLPCAQPAMATRASPVPHTAPRILLCLHYTCCQHIHVSCSSFYPSKTPFLPGRLSLLMADFNLKFSLFLPVGSGSFVYGETSLPGEMGSQRVLPGEPNTAIIAKVWIFTLLCSLQLFSPQAGETGTVIIFLIPYKV